MQRILSPLLLIGILTSASAWAQTSAGGSIRGVVRDQQGAVMQGVTLSASSPSAPRIFTVVSDADGTFRLVDLPPGEYRLTAELPSFSKSVRDGVLVRAGLNVTIDVSMTLGSMEETVQVKADTPLLESSSTVQAVNVSGDLQRSLPLANRNEWHEFMGLAPGVVSYQTRFTGYFVHGADEISSTYQLDGASITSGLQSSNFFTQLSTEAIDDTQVKTAGVDAASPLGVGAVVSIASKSGTNTLRGTAGVTYRPGEWNGNNNPGGTSVATSMVQPDLSIGGPLIRDRWWGFGAYRHADIDTGISRTADQVAILEAIAPGFEPFDDPNDAHFWFLKTSAQLANHNVEFWFQNDRNPSSLSQTFYTEPLVDLVLGGSVYTARMSSVWAPTVTSRFLVSYNNKTNSRLAVRDDVPGRLVHQQAMLNAGRLRGTGPIALLDNANLQGTLAPYHYWTISGDLRWFKQGWGGSHELEAGAYLQPWYHEERQFTYANGGFYLEELVLRDRNNPAAGLIPFHRQIFETGSVTNLLLDTSDNAFYLQDAWKPTSRLTINAGVRVDVIHRVDVPFDVVVEDSVEVGPRFGANYALTADRRNLVRASWGRVHDNLTNTATNAGANNPSFQDLYDNDLNGTFEAVFVTPGRSGTATDRIIDPGYHQSYINESLVVQPPAAGADDPVGELHPARIPRSSRARRYQRDLRERRVPGLSQRSVQRDLPADQQPVELAGLQGHRPRVVDANSAPADDRELLPPVAPPRRHLAAERSRLLHPARCLLERQRDRQHADRDHRPGRDRGWRRLEQPVWHEPDGVTGVARPHRAARRGVARAVRHHALGQLCVPIRALVGTGGDAYCRARSRLRPDHGTTLQRPCRDEPAGDADSLRLPDPWRRPAPNA